MIMNNDSHRFASPGRIPPVNSRLCRRVGTAAALTGMSRRNCIRYANGEIAVPEPVARLLRSLVALKGLGYELTPDDELGE